jgi:membrane protein YqaA with SNARE-associated domain
MSGPPNLDSSASDQALSLENGAVSFQKEGESTSLLSKLSPRVLLNLLILLGITLGSFWAALNADWILELGNWGILGVALINFFASATVILPAPGLAVVFTMGGVFDPITLGIACGIASGLGELSGYIAGATGRQLVNEKSISPWLHQFTTRYTALALFILAIVPLPLFDIAGILAGAMRMRIPVFLFAVISGKIIKHTLVALMGAGILPVVRILIGG